jgi:hypothetical protein
MYEMDKSSLHNEIAVDGLFQPQQTLHQHYTSKRVQEKDAQIFLSIINPIRTPSNTNNAGAPLGAIHKKKFKFGNLRPPPPVAL